MTKWVVGHGEEVEDARIVLYLAGPSVDELAHNGTRGDEPLQLDVEGLREVVGSSVAKSRPFWPLALFVQIGIHVHEFVETMIKILMN